MIKDYHPISIQDLHSQCATHDACLVWAVVNCVFGPTLTMGFEILEENAFQGALLSLCVPSYKS